jgi:hypothetical protein
MPSSKGNTVVAGDVFGSAHTFNTEADVNDFAADQSGHIHLLHKYDPRKMADGRRVSIVDVSGNSVSEYDLPVVAGRVQPIIKSSGVTWVTQEALFSASSFTPFVLPSKLQDINDTGVQVRYVGPLNDGGYYTFGSGSEIITLHSSDGSVSGSFPAPLDKAYQAIGHPVPKQPPAPGGSGTVRVIWAAGTPNGQLYICLSGLKTAGPAYIAVVDAQTGTLLKVIAASLPAFPELITAVNPLGTVIPATGAVDDHLVMVDQVKGSVAIY